MGKRSNFARNIHDLYCTPYKAVEPLLPHLPAKIKYIEPCVGHGDLVNHLNLHGHICVASSDLEKDVCTTQYDLQYADYFITNPPWSRHILHSTIDNLRCQLPTWLLFDADWMFTKQAKQYLPYCDKIVSVGRVKWIQDSPSVGKDNAAWYLFVAEQTEIKFIGSI